MSELSTTFITGLSISLAFITLLFVMLLYYKSKREARYDQDRHRAELEMLRDSLEKKIYQITEKLLSTEGRWSDVNHLLVSRLKSQPDITNLENNACDSNFLKSYGITPQDFKIDPKLVFVLTPFNNQFVETYEEISSACKELGLNCFRGDEEYVKGDLMPHIIKLIVKANIIIANIDGRNPNVFYELGVAHTLDKVTILITSALEKAPFDLKGKKLLLFKDKTQFRADLQKELARSLIGQRTGETISNKKVNLTAGSSVL